MEPHVLLREPFLTDEHVVARVRDQEFLVEETSSINFEVGVHGEGDGAFVFVFPVQKLYGTFQGLDASTERFGLNGSGVTNEEEDVCSGITEGSHLYSETMHLDLSWYGEGGVT